MEYFTNNYDPLVKKQDGKFTVKYDKGTTSQFSEDTVMYQNSYIPVTLTIEKNKIKEDEIQGLIEILKPVIEKLLQTKIKNIEVLDRRDYYVFNPINEYGTSVFENSQYLNEFYSTIKLEYLVGYTLLSNSPLTRYILSKEKHDLDIKYFLNIALISLSSFKLLDIDSQIISLETKGYFTYSFGIHDLDDHELIRELCMLYNINIIDSKDLSTFILQTDVDFYTTPEEWIRYNLPIIKSGQFPTFTLKNITNYYDNDYQRKNGTVFKNTILKYISYMAYAKLSDNNEIIKPFIFSTFVNEDLSITLSLPSYKLVQEYNDIVTDLSKNKYSVEQCSNLKEGIIKRFIVQNIDNDAYPMVFNKGGDILIHRSPLAIIHPSPFDFSLENMEKTEIQLLNKMREYYSKTNVCHDDLEAVSLDKISEMNLDQLLTLIPITEDNITYCFSKDTVSKIETNPLTRRPLSEKTLLKRKYLDYGLRGVFDIGVLYGLYPDVPTKINIKVEKGIPRVRRIKVDLNSKELVGNLFLVDVIFSDGTLTPLFEISLPTVGLEKIDELKYYVNKLWEKGFFLNYWISAINKYLDLKSFPVLITDTILLHAKDSLFDGYKAMEYLKMNI